MFSLFPAPPKKSLEFSDSFCTKSTSTSSLDDLEEYGRCSCIGACTTCDQNIELHPEHETRRRLKSFALWVYFVFSGLTIVSLGALLLQYHYYYEHTPPELYSPLNKFISYKAVEFDTTQPIYKGNASVVDQAWMNLVNPGVMELSESEIQTFGHPSYEIPGTPEMYLVQVDMFEQLRCLNDIRRNFYGGGIMSTEEFDNCVDHIRQGIMCTGDTAITPMYWDEETRTVLPNSTAMHVCRDFEKLQSAVNDSLHLSYLYENGIIRG